jgi:hypothetical protein
VILPPPQPTSPLLLRIYIYIYIYIYTHTHTHTYQPPCLILNLSVLLICLKLFAKEDSDFNLRWKIVKEYRDSWDDVNEVIPPVQQTACNKIVNNPVTSLLVQIAPLKMATKRYTICSFGNKPVLLKNALQLTNIVEINILYNLLQNRNRVYVYSQTHNDLNIEQ